jgi:rod shape-determining protein MreC
MDTSRDDVGIAIRSAFLAKGTKQRFSLLILIIISIIFIFIETIEKKPLNYFRAFIKDAIYRGAQIVSVPSSSFDSFSSYINKHLNLYENYNLLKKENLKLKSNISDSDYLVLENTQLRKVIEEQLYSPKNIASARVLIDKKSPYVNSFIINIGSNKNVQNGMAVLDGKNFIGKIVDVNFFSSRVLLISDLNSRIAVVTEPSAYHAILSGHGKNKPTLEFLPEINDVKDGDKIYTSGKEGIFAPGIPIGNIKIKNNIFEVDLFSNSSQVTFVNINSGNLENNR